MPKLEKTLHGDLDEIEKKIHHGIVTNSAMTARRDRWEAKVGENIRCVMMVYEKYAEKVLAHRDKLPEGWDSDYKPSWFNIYAQDAFEDAPHYAIAITLLDDGEEIKLCSITSGSGQESYYSPLVGPEGELHGVLSLTLENLDNYIL